MAEREEPLAGGYVTRVVRVGQTVHRAMGPWSPAVHALLRHLEAVGFRGVPRLLGIDAAGREVLSFIDGAVPAGAGPLVVTDAALGDVGQMMRALHQAVAGFVLPAGRSWHFPSLGGPAPHRICHHDLSPRNTVFRDGRAVAFIDWDLATPEAPIHDVVHAAWQFVPLGTDAACRRAGWPAPPDRGARLRLLVDAYALPPGDRIGFARRVADRIAITATGIEALAAAGNPPFQRLVAAGVPARLRRDRHWVLRHAADLDSQLLAERAAPP